MFEIDIIQQKKESHTVTFTRQQIKIAVVIFKLQKVLGKEEMVGMQYEYAPSKCFTTNQMNDIFTCIIQNRSTKLHYPDITQRGLEFEYKCKVYSQYALFPQKLSSQDKHLYEFSSNHNYDKTMLYDKITHRSETNGQLDPCQAIPTPVISKITHPLLSMDHFFPAVRY